MRPGTAWLLALLTTAALTACGDGGADNNPGAVPEELLTVADLPDGWKTVPADDGEDGTSPCLDKLFGQGGHLAPSAGAVAFAAGPDGPFLYAGSVDRPTEQALPEIDGIVVPCDATTGPTGYALKVQGAVIPGLPSDSFAAEGTNSKEGATFRYTVVAAGTDEATAVVLVGARTGAVDQMVVADALNAMHDRLPRS